MQHVACAHTSVESLPFLLFLSQPGELLPLPQPQQPQLLLSTKVNTLHTHKPHHTEQQLNHLFCWVGSATEEGNVQPLALTTLPDSARTPLKPHLYSSSHHLMFPWPPFSLPALQGCSGTSTSQLHTGWQLHLSHRSRALYGIQVVMKYRQGRQISKDLGGKKKKKPSTSLIFIHLNIMFSYIRHIFLLRKTLSRWTGWWDVGNWKVKGERIKNERNN